MTVPDPVMERALPLGPRSAGPEMTSNETGSFEVADATRSNEAALASFGAGAVNFIVWVLVGTGVAGLPATVTGTEVWAVLPLVSVAVRVRVADPAPTGLRERVWPATRVAVATLGWSLATVKETTARSPVEAGNSGMTVVLLTVMRLSTVKLV